MSVKTTRICDLCQGDVTGADAETIAFDFGDGCRFGGDACVECLEKLRDAIRSKARYQTYNNWPSFWAPRVEEEVAP